MTDRLPFDMQWLWKFEDVRTQAQPIVHKITAASDASDEALLTALREAVEKLPQYLQAMREIPEPKGKEMRKVRKDFLDGLALYIKGCEAHIKWFDTQKRWYLSEWKTFIDEAAKRFEKSAKRIPTASKKAMES